MDGYRPQARRHMDTWPPAGCARVAQKKDSPLMAMSSTSNSRVAPGGMSGGAPRWPSAAPHNDTRSDSAWRSVVRTA
eukprot:scaffold54856_cov36-Phaeocystis_antarctica.AAC.1